MNVYLKSAVQNLDAHITALQEIRNQLARGIDAPVMGVQVFKPEPAELPPRETRDVETETVQTSEPTFAKATARQARKSGKSFAKVMRKANGGGAKTKGGTSNAEHSTPNAEGKTAPALVKPALATGRTLPPSQPGDRAKTLGGAMKLIIAAMGTFTREALRETLEKDYGSEEFVKDASGSGFPGNLGYWLKSGKLEESLGGVLKVVDREFFGSVEFKT